MSEFNIEAKAEKLCDIIMKKDEFWETKNKAILLLIDLVLPYENQPEDVLDEVFTAGFFRILKEPVKAMICDLRSQQVRDICSLLSVVSQICNDRMKGFLRDCFNNILDGIKVPNKTMSGYVDESILLMIRNVSFKSAIPLIVTEIKDNKAKYVRERCLDYLNEILINWEVNDREADNLCDGIRAGLEDASVKGREIARSAYMNMFQRFPKKTEKIKSTLTASSLKVKLAQAESDLTMNTSSSTIDSTVTSSTISEKKPPATATKAPPATPAHHHREREDSHAPATTAPKTTEKAHKRASNTATTANTSRDHSHGGNHALGSSTGSNASSVSSSSSHHHAPAPAVVKEVAAPVVPASVAAVANFRNSVRRRSMVANPFESITNFHSSIEIDNDDYGPNKSSPTLSNGSNHASPSKLNHSSPSKVNHATAGSPAKKTTHGGGFHVDTPPKKPPVSAPSPPLIIDHAHHVPRTDSAMSNNSTSNSVNLNFSMPKSINLNNLVRVSRGKDVSANGIVRFIGKTDFASGYWIGVELFTDVGKNNGTVQGVSYFECPANRGLFVKEENVEVLDSVAMSKPTPAHVSEKRSSGDNIGDEIRDALLTTSSFVKSTSNNSLPLASPVVMVHGHVSHVNEFNGVEKRSQLKGVLKLKVSQLLETLNGQMEIVKQLEEEDKHSTPFNSDRYRGIIDEVVDMTTHELELIHSFKSSLVTQQLY